MSTELSTSEFTTEEAQAFTEQLKTSGRALWEKFHDALTGRIWIALGYQEGEAGWHEYLGDHFPDGPLTPPREKQLEAIDQLGESMSNRALASVMGLSEGTIRNRKQELAQIAGAQNYAPGNVQGIDGKQYANRQPDAGGSGEVVDAELVDEGERPDRQTGQSWDANGTSRQFGDDGTDASAYGFSPLELESGGNALQLRKKDTVTSTIRAFNGSGSSDTAQINGTATELIEHMTSGLVPADIWDEDDLFEVADAAVSTVSVLTDLLLCMARPNRTEGVSRSAITNSEVPGSVADLVLKVEDLVAALNRESSVL